MEGFALSQKIKLLALVSVAAIGMATPIVAKFEGRNLVAYLDPVGIPTICSGITTDVHMGDIATEQWCDERMREELVKADMTILLNVYPDVIFDMPVTRRASLLSFIYNVGPDAFLRSTLLKKLNAGDARGACDEMLRWVYAGGRKLKGLERRRAAERELCLKS